MKVYTEDGWQSSVIHMKQYGGRIPKKYIIIQNNNMLDFVKFSLENNLILEWLSNTQSIIRGVMDIPIAASLVKKDWIIDFNL